MHVKANRTYKIVKSARISAKKGRVVAGTSLKTLTDPVTRGGEEKVLVQYSGSGESGEAATGTKFWLRLRDIDSLCEE